MGTADQSAEDLHEALADWYVRLDGEQATDADRGAFEAWLSASDARLRAHAEMTAGLDALARATLAPGVFEERLAPLLEAEDREARRNIVALPRRRGAWRTALAAAASLAVLVASGFAVLQTMEKTATVLATPVGATMTVKLDDGSTVYLNTDTRLSYALSESERTVRLERGEAYFEVARDPGRPFAVTAAAHTVTVLGTAFDVRIEGGGSYLTVTEGATRVSQVAAGILTRRETRDVKAGMSARMAADGAITVTSTQGLDTVGSWRTGRLVYRDRPIAEILADLDRYMSGELVLANPERGHEMFTVVLQVDSETAMLKRMAQLLPVTLREVRPGVYEVSVR